MHGISSSPLTDTFTANGVGQLIPVKPGATNLYPVIRDCVSTFTSAAVTGAAMLSFDVQLLDGTFVDSGIPSVSVAGTITGTLVGTANSGIIKGARHRMTGLTGGTCTVTNKLVDIL